MKTQTALLGHVTLPDILEWQLSKNHESKIDRLLSGDETERRSSKNSKSQSRDTVSAKTASNGSGLSGITSSQGRTKQRLLKRAILPPLTSSVIQTSIPLVQKSSSQNTPPAPLSPSGKLHTSVSTPCHYCGSLGVKIIKSFEYCPSCSLYRQI
jgi:hypothetical protein